VHYVKLETSDGETRWINLAQVSRVTSVMEANRRVKVVVVMFGDARSETAFKLCGDNDQDRAAIKVLEASLDALSRRSGGATSRRAAAARRATRARPR
jgi:hypothetical protein